MSPTAASDPGAQSVAVIIAAYRAEQVIARAVRSALAQPEAREIIVAVDASPDGTASAARTCDDGSGRLAVIELRVNRGPAAARNAAIAASTSAWITVLDADDFMEPRRLAKLMARAIDVDFIADDLWLVEEGAEAGPRSPMWFAERSEAHTITLADFVNANCPDPKRPRRELGFLKPLMRRKFLYEKGLFYEEAMRLGEDYDLYARALAAGARFVLTEAQGYVAVRRAASLSARHGAGELLALRAADDRLMKTPGLAPAEVAAIHRHRLTTNKRYQWQRLIDAVKARHVHEAAACFLSGPATSAHLAGQLWAQFRLRVLKAA